MARFAVKYSPSTGGNGLVTDPLDTGGALYGVVVSTLATLVADGPSPTQAHVTAVNNAWTAYIALLATAAGDMLLSINGTTITSGNQVRAGLLMMQSVLAGSNRLATP